MILNEHGPKDLINAYKNYYGRSVRDIDYENSQFREISKEEAREHVKNKDGTMLHLLLDDDLIFINADDSIRRHPYFVTDPDFFYKYLNNQSYITYPVKHLTSLGAIKEASKIYAVQLVPYDAEKREKRNANDISYIVDTPPEWPGRTSRGLVPTGDTQDLRFRPNNTLNNTSVYKKLHQAHDEYEQKILGIINSLKKDIDATQQKLAISDENSVEYKEAVDHLDSLKRNLRQFNQSLIDDRIRFKRALGNAKDAKAAMRYADSTKNLQSNLVMKMDTLKDIDRLNKKIEHASEIISDIKTDGSQKTRERRQELLAAQKKLNAYSNRVNDIQSQLENASLYDQEELEAAVQKYDELTSQINELQSLTRRLANIKARRGG